MKKLYFLAAGALALGISGTSALAATGNNAGKTKVSRDESKVETVSAVLSVAQRAATQRTVLAEKTLAPGVVKRVVRDGSGHVFCDIVRDGNVSGGRQSIRPTMRAPQGATFYEGFESHVDQLDWLPEGWTEINTEANTPTLEMCAHNINNSWSVQDTGDGYWTDITSDGVKEAWIHFTYDWSYTNSAGETVKGGPDLQNEWLISPAINIEDGDNLYFLAEIDLGAIYPFSFSTMKYDRETDPECDLEVLVTTDNGANWTSVWKASSNVCASMTDDEMYDVMAELKYNSYSVSLVDYADKEIKIAFRYYNIGDGWAGNSMAVDAVTVSAPQPVALYELPYGSLLQGMTEELSILSESYALMPAWAHVTWEATPDVANQSYVWNFYDTEAGDMSKELNGEQASIEYPYSEGNALAYPQLTAQSGDLADVFTYDANDAEPGGIYYGGRLPNVVFQDGSEEMPFVGNYDYQHKRLVCPYLSTNAYCFGTSPANTWGTGVVQTAVANFFYAPATPFTIEDVMVTLGEYDADDDAEFTLEIFEVSETGQVSATPVTTAKIKGSDIDGFGFYQAKFHLDVPYIMSGNTLMMVSGYADNDKVRTFAVCAQATKNDAAHNYAYMKFTINGQETLLSASQALQDYSSALYFSLNGTFHFLRAIDEIVEIGKDETSATAAFTASNAAENWWIVDGDNKLPLVADGTIHDWLTATPTIKEDGTHAVVFSAALTDSNRAKTVTLCNGGTETRVRVRQQATSGIASISNDSSKGISVVNDILSVAEAGNSVITVYGIDGGIVASGSNGLNISNVAAGIYIVRCGKATYKFVK